MKTYQNVESFQKKVDYFPTAQEESEVKALFLSKNFKAPSSYIDFIKSYGAILIMSDAYALGVSEIPRITIENNYTPIGRFLKWDDSHNSISEILKMYDDQFPANFIPFIEGCLGDYIGFSINKNGTYTINYWFHEELFSQITHVVSIDFMSFIESIIEHSIDYDEIVIKNITHTPSPKMIELLKKTGKWKGE